MKKGFSVILSVLMVALLFVPALGAGSHTVTFVQPSAAYEGAYVFSKVENDTVKFVEDPDGIYVFYDNRYMTLDNIFERYWDQVPPERYSPDAYAATETIADGETLEFMIVTSPAYNVATATVLVNSVKLEPNTMGVYTVAADRDLTIRVMENAENGETGLQRNLYNVKLVSGDGFNAKAPMGEGYEGTYYGDDFYFRVKIKKGYSGSAMKVAVMRDVDSAQDFMAEFDTVGNLLNLTEQLTSYGTDSEGCRLYKVENVTSDCRLVITGVKEEKTANILSMILKVLRKILDFLGVRIQFLDDMTDEFNVRVDNGLASAGVSYSFLSGTANEDGTLTVMSGSGTVLQIVKTEEDQEVRVSWTPGNEDGAYITNWVGKRDRATGETIFVANYNIDNIKGDTVVTIG